MKINGRRDYLTISELAGLNNISTDTLRYYDRIGLFRPEYVDEFTGYRYYAYSQCEQISTILELKNWGIPLEQIRQYMECRNIATSEALLGNVCDELQKKIKVLRNTEKMIRTKIEFMEQITEERTGRLEIEELPERTVICMGEYIELFKEGVFQQLKLEALLGRQISAYATNKIGTLIDADSLFDEKKQALRRSAMYIVEKEERKLLKQIDPAYIQTLPAGRYLCVNGYGRFRYSCEMAQKIREHILAQGLSVCGNIVEQDLIDISVTNDVNEILHRIEIPVSE